MKIKLSDLYTGTVLKLNYQFRKIDIGYYIVLTDLLMESNADSGEFLYFTIVGRKLFLTGNSHKKFDLNQIRREEVLSDKYVIDYDCSIVPVEDLPLLINEPRKTVWFDRVLKGDIRDKGMNFHKAMLKFLEEENG